MADRSTLLCIDDDRLGLHVRQVVLERAGFRVFTACDGESGLALFSQRRFDAVILDFAMPGMDGGQVAARMRATRAEVPILLLSAYVNLPTEVIKSVNFTMTKGGRAEMLIEKIQEMLSVPREQRPRSDGESV